MYKKNGRRPRRETAMPCAPPKEEEVRVGYLKYHFYLLYVKEKKRFNRFFYYIWLNFVGKGY